MQGKPHDTNSRTLGSYIQARMKWDNIFKVQKVENCQPRIQHLANIFFRNNGETKTCPGKQKLMKLIAIRPNEKKC